MPRDDATDEGKVQVVDKNRELRVLAVTVRMDCHIRGDGDLPRIVENIYAARPKRPCDKGLSLTFALA